MIHPKTELKLVNPTVGYGVFATEFIPKGTIVYVKDSLEIQVSPEQYAELPPVLQDSVEKYSYIDEKGFRIVSWDIGKYVNHCCNCNTISTGYGFEIAVRDIQAGEEITDEYGIFNLQYDMPLQCKNKNCRKILTTKDFDIYYEAWDDKIKSALEKFYAVEQPLLPMVEANIREDLDDYLQNQKEYKSVYTLKISEILKD